MELRNKDKSGTRIINIFFKASAELMNIEQDKTGQESHEEE